MAAALGPFDDLAELLGEPAAYRVHALALAVDERPGDALEIDGEAPVVKLGSGVGMVDPIRRQLGLSAARNVAGALWLGRLLVRGKRGGVEIVDRDDAGDEIAKLGKRARFVGVITPFDLASSIQSLL